MDRKTPSDDTMKRKIILNLATSLDGYISDNDGGFAWIVGHGDKSNDTKKQFDFPDFVDIVDTIVMGKNAYLDCGIEDIEDYESKKFYVATSKGMETKYKNVEVIGGDVCGRVLELREEEGKNIWLFGGAGLTDGFIKAGIVDEYIIGIIPIMLGKGRRLFLDNNPGVKLHLDEYTVQDGIVILRYTKRGKSQQDQSD